MKRYRVGRLTLGLLTVLAIALVGVQAAFGDAASEVRALTGAHTRLVWVRHTGDGTDIFAKTANLRLLGFDTDDGRGEREILPGESNFHKPLFTPSGRQVVFSNDVAKTVHVVNWDGTGLRTLTSGVAAGVWMDPQTRAEWVYVQTGPETGQKFRNNPIRRYRIDDPRVSELVWDKTPLTPESFQVSPDGRRACSLFPWPRVSVALLPNESLEDLGQGCCPSLAPDNGDLAFYLIGDHRHLVLNSLSRQARWQVAINTAPGVDGFEVYHPVWTNQTRFIVVTGPYLGKGGLTADVYLGRFDEKFSRIEAWARVTHDDKGDFYPDAWIDPTPAPEIRFTLSGTPVQEPPPAPR